MLHFLLFGFYLDMSPYFSFDLGDYTVHAYNDIMWLTHVLGRSSENGVVQSNSANVIEELYE